MFSAARRLTVFAFQLVTGILLALIYVPSAGEAWNSLQILNHQVTLGWFIRALHGWGSNFMLAIVLIHMVQVFLFGAYKFPRELTWILGIFLLLMTLGDGLHRPGAAIRPGRLLGTGNRGVDLEPRADRGSPACQAIVGRPDHCGRDSLAFLRISRLCDSRLADRFCWTAFAAGPETRDQRVAYAGPIGPPRPTIWRSTTN